MKVAVTGASGFIGQYVIRELARFDGLEVIAAARCTMDASRLPRSTRCVQLDIEDEATSSAAYELLGYPHVLIHLAWAGLPNYKALYHFEGHLARQYRFLSGLVREGLPSLTCAGTCFEYGMRFGSSPPQCSEVTVRSACPAASSCAISCQSTPWLE
jgi:nucleoside-diphosphate-sugar epimerase